ncbi:MAG: cell division FtsA domain-containing protein [Candidatus Dojkabacteria bacterium]|nr:MAG: cell division FtsA domain-containing protein [Candidatus Dojkabacteria bacterium]
MKLFSLFGGAQSAKKTSKYLISLDIGTEVMKGLLFSMSNLGVDIWATNQVTQQTHAMRSGVILNSDTVLENARLCVQKLVSKLEPQEVPTKMVLGMAGELVNGISIRVSYDRGRDAGRKISESEANTVVENVISDILTKGRDELAKRLDTTEDNVEVLQITVTGMFADGVKIESMIGSSPEEVVLHLYASFAPKTYINTLRELSDELGLEIASIVTQPFAVSRSFAGSWDSQFSGIFIDIGGGTTDVALVQNGDTIQTQMYAFGGRAFTKKIAQSMDVSYTVAEGRKIKYATGELPQDLRDEVRRLIAPDVQLWLDALVVAMEEFENVEEFPPQFFLCGGGAMLPDLKEAILSYPWHKHLPFKRLPKVMLVTPDKLDKVYDKSGLLIHPYDVTPTSLAKFYWDVLRLPNLNYLGTY